MTGKQFELEVLNDYEYVIAEFDKDNYYLDDENSAKSLECRLNELFEENEQLKRQIGNLEHTKDFCDEVIADCERLENENKQLQQQIADLETSFDICKHYKETYGDEIVHIKHTIKDMMENERTELGRSVLRQLWEAIQ